MPYFITADRTWEKALNKTDKKKAEGFLKTAGDIHNVIKKTADAGNREEALAFLGQCQELAIQTGELIERSEGEGFVTVTLIESYCELVYKIYEEIRWAQSVNGSRIYNLLAAKLIQIGKSIRNDIPVRREAVFLPYKASMWDSLESVWRAAEEDPDCDAFVIPIPYFDKNPDGSLGEMHYEGDQYPDDVPVTHYEDYDFEGRHPDMVFIHNPYDKYNYVTTVHPFFYSGNLKKYTDKLIYIPYFVLEEIDPDDKEAVESMKHFCMVPGVIYADQVIVQSENMRRVYIDVMTEYMKNSSVGRSYWEKKILGLGSPKIDRILKAKGEEQKIPEPWMHILQKPDGSLKKVILYNTGVSVPLEHGEKALEKMKDVFQVFKKNQEEAVLWWRPHPLIRTTISSMKPELCDAYDRLVEWYKAEGWGVYDDTSDVDRAIAVSDAYYGDWSSLVTLCRSVGMPVMIQDVNVNS